MEPALVDFIQIYEWVSKAGFPATLALILWANWKRYYYWRWYVEELRADRDAWKATAKDLGGITETSLNIAEKKQ